MCKFFICGISLSLLKTQCHWTAVHSFMQQRSIIKDFNLSYQAMTKSSSTHSLEGVLFNGVLKHWNITWVIERLSEAFNLVHQTQTRSLLNLIMLRFLLQSFMLRFNNNLDVKFYLWLIASWRECVVLAINFLPCRFLTDSREGA